MMCRNLCLLASVLLFLPALAFADSQPWMKKAVPNELVVFSRADEECPLNENALMELAETVLARSNIKRVDEYDDHMSDVSSNVYLTISLSCLPENAPEWIQSLRGTEEPLTQPGESFVSLEVNFVGLAFYSPKNTAWVRFGWDAASGFLGKGSGETLGILVEARVREAVQDYLDANSDVEERATEE